MKCFEIVKREDRIFLLSYFNSLASKDAQGLYLDSLITLNNVSRKRPRNIDSKGYNSSYKYKLFITNQEVITSKKSFVHVCIQGRREGGSTGLFCPGRQVDRGARSRI